MSRCLSGATLLLLALVAVPPLGATEVGATRLVFEKSTKMKKIEASLYLSFRSGETRSVACDVGARGKKGPIATAGVLKLWLRGEADGEAWSSSALEVTLEAGSDNLFTAAEIDALAAEADGGTEIRRLQVDFDGGRGGRATELTMDCVYERASM